MPKKNHEYFMKMSMKKIILALCSLCTVMSFAQTLNDYEYVSISPKYNFQRTPDEYQLNRLLKCQLEEYGFNVLYNSDLANVQESDRCYILNANVIPKSNIFLFKFIIEFTDCNNSVIYQSEIGGSSEKDHHDAFTAALDGALKSPNLLKYKYEGVKRQIILTNGNALEITKVEPALEAISTLQQNPSASTEVKIVASALQDAVKAASKGNNDEIAKPTVVNKNTSTVAVSTPKVVPQNPAVKIPVKEQSKATQITAEVKAEVDSSKKEAIQKEDSFSGMLLYAQAIENGYQLIDTTPKVILKITNTLQANYYEARIDQKFGAVFMKNDQWVFEYFIDGRLVSEPLTIKFCD